MNLFHLKLISLIKLNSSSFCLSLLVFYFLATSVVIQCTNDKFKVENLNFTIRLTNSLHGLIFLNYTAKFIRKCQGLKKRVDNKIILFNDFQTSLIVMDSIRHYDQSAENEIFFTFFYHSTTQHVDPLRLVAFVEKSDQFDQVQQTCE